MLMVEVENVSRIGISPSGLSKCIQFSSIVSNFGLPRDESECIPAFILSGGKGG